MCLRLAAHRSASGGRCDRSVRLVLMRHSTPRGSPRSSTGGVHFSFFFFLNCPPFHFHILVIIDVLVLAKLIGQTRFVLTRNKTDTDL